MVALCIFADNGEVYVMGHDRESVVQCVQKGAASRKIKYIDEPKQRLNYLARAMEVIEGKQQ